jgi:integrase
LEIAPDGSTKRVLRHQGLEPMSRREAAAILAQKVAASANSTKPTRSRVTFGVLATDWETTVVPMYMHSTQKNHRHILKKQLLPRFGDMEIADVTTQEIQAYVAQLVHAQYAPKTIDHFHDVLSPILRTAVKWGHVTRNPARDVDLPPLRNVRPKWVLTTVQAGQLLQVLPPLARTTVGVAMMTGLRRGELFALRWKAIDLQERHLTVQEAVYRVPRRPMFCSSGRGLMNSSSVITATGLTRRWT